MSRSNKNTNIIFEKCRKQITPTSITIHTDSSISSSNSRQYKIKNAVSREFDNNERYYEIKTSEDYQTRKEQYMVDDYLHKNKLRGLPDTKIMKKSNIPRCYLTGKPVECYINRYYSTITEQRTNIKPSKPIDGIDIEIQDVKPEEKINKDPNKVPMDWDNYHRLAVIHKFMEDLESDYPSLCTTGIIGKSLEGRDLKISNSDASNASVWIDAGIHAREWIAPAVNTYVANHIAKNFDSMPKSVRNKDWYFLPVLNPDGYEYSHTTNRMWRKNKALVKRQLFGVDLNRNFSLAWGGLGSSDQPTHAFYRGPEPFSEPESSAMRDIFLHSGISFKVYLTLHSFGQVIIMPFAYSNQLADDYIRLLEGATIMSKAIYDTNGNTYKVGISTDVMYHASGTSNDWSHGVVKIPFCYLIELRSRKHKFKLPKEEIAETGAEILNCVVALMEFIDNYIYKPMTDKSVELPKPELKKKIIIPKIVNRKEDLSKKSLIINEKNELIKELISDPSNNTNISEERMNECPLTIAQFEEDSEESDV